MEHPSWCEGLRISLQIQSCDSANKRGSRFSQTVHEPAIAEEIWFTGKWVVTLRYLFSLRKAAFSVIYNNPSRLSPVCVCVIIVLRQISQMDYKQSLFKSSNPHTIKMSTYRALFRCGEAKSKSSLSVGFLAMIRSSEYLVKLHVHTGMCPCILNPVCLRVLKGLSETLPTFSYASINLQ